MQMHLSKRIIRAAIHIHIHNIICIFANTKITKKNRKRMNLGRYLFNGFTQQVVVCIECNDVQHVRNDKI